MRIDFHWSYAYGFTYDSHLFAYQYMFLFHSEHRRLHRRLCAWLCFPGHRSAAGCHPPCSLSEQLSAVESHAQFQWFVRCQISDNDLWNSDSTGYYAGVIVVLNSFEQLNHTFLILVICSKNILNQLRQSKVLRRGVTGTQKVGGKGTNKFIRSKCRIKKM